MKYSIIRFDKSTLRFLPRPEDPFDVIGRLVPVFDGRKWSHYEELYDRPGTKTYESDIYDPSVYVNSPNEAAFLAMSGDMCVGSVRVSKKWNNNAFIDDIAVDRAHRGQGAGTALMDAAVLWGKDNNLHGAALETQDNNLLACRFYIKYGFKLGAADRFLYDAFPNRDETALFFYLLP